MTTSSKPRRRRESRGEYRTVYVCLADDTDFHALSGDAAKLLLVLMLTLPAAGIAVVYPSKLCDQTGVNRARLEELFGELERPKAGKDLGWIVREGNVVWVVNALRCAGTLAPEHRQQRAYVAKLIANLGSRPIVDRFRAQYPEWFHTGDPEDAPEKEGSAEPPPSLNQGFTEAQTSVTRGPVGYGRVDIENEPARAGVVGNITPDYTTRCTIALNLGMQRNPAVRCTEVSTSSQLGRVTWEDDGIPVEVAETMIAESCRAFVPKPDDPSIGSLRYFDKPVRRRWADLQASGSADPSTWVPGARDAIDNARAKRLGY